MDPILVGLLVFIGLAVAIGTFEWAARHRNWLGPLVVILGATVMLAGSPRALRAAAYTAALLPAVMLMVHAARKVKLLVSAYCFLGTYVALWWDKQAWRMARPFTVVLAMSALMGWGLEEMLVMERYFWGLSLFGTGVAWLVLVMKGGLKEMGFNILDIVDERDKLEAFFAEEEQGRSGAAKVVRIEPEKAIAAIKEDVIGQDEAVEEVVKTLARRVELRRSGKPLGTFMFVGATGAGKTELAKSIAKHIFEGRLARFDMNEFTASHTVSRLIGSPPGYVDSDKGGQLTQAIKQLGTGVILFDEIEKADPDVYKVIMTLLDEGRITEQSTGEAMDASGFVIIMTSNARHRELATIAETIQDKMERRRAVKDALAQIFRPEQLARIDEIFLFRKLGRRALAQIVGKFLKKFADEARVNLVRVDADLILDMLAKHERLENYGVRELVRIVENEVIDGMIECRNRGYQNVNITVQGERVQVLPVL